MGCNCIRLKKEHIGSGNFRYTFSCTNDVGQNRLVTAVAGNDNEAERLALLECEDFQTNHVDNSIFLGDLAQVDSIIDENKREQFSSYLINLSNPLAAQKILSTEKVKTIPEPKGGSATLTALNQRFLLGGSKCGQKITVTIGGQAVVAIEMWFTLAQIPAGGWTYAGPTSVTLQLNCTTITNSPFGCPDWFGQPVNVFAVAKSGNLPLFVSFNP